MGAVPSPKIQRSRKHFVSKLIVVSILGGFFPLFFMTSFQTLLSIPPPPLNVLTPGTKVADDG